MSPRLSPTRRVQPAALVALWAGAARADVTSQDDLIRVMGGSIRDTGDVTWFLIAAIAVVLFAVLFHRVYTRRTAPLSRTRKRPAPAPRREFAELAGAMGFRHIEVRNLRRIARRVARGGDPANLLTTESGRRYLTADLRRRVKRRQQEVAMLEGILERLGTSTDLSYHDREGERVETDVAIWLVNKVPGDSPVDDQEVVVDIVPVSGRLLDLSEGGAAISADVHLAAGDLIEFWSADSQIWLPPIQCGVVDSDGKDGEDDEDGEAHVHLHFLNPPVSDVRKAIMAIRRLEQEALEDAGDDPPAAANGAEIAPVDP